MQTTFTWHSITFAVRPHPTTGAPVYRDVRHFGGPWSDAARDIACRSLHHGFRSALRRAADAIYARSRMYVEP